MTTFIARAPLATLAQFQASNCGCDTFSDEEIEEALDAASDAISRRCPDVRGRSTVRYRPVNMTDSWCVLESDMNVSYLPLPGLNPELTQVKLEGDILTAGTDYVILDGNKLIRLVDGEPSVWPSAQKVWKADTEDDTFSISVTSGYGDDNRIVRDACIAITCTILKGASIRRSALPPGTTGYQLRGQSAQVKDAAEAAVEGHANLVEVARLMAWAADGGMGGAYSVDDLSGWRFHLLPQ